MQNEGVRFADDLKSMPKVHTIILHSAFCILHFSLQAPGNLIFYIVERR